MREPRNSTMLGSLVGMRSATAEDQVLAVLIEQQHEMINVSQTAQRSGVPSATANRIVSRLVDTGLVRDKQDGRDRMVWIDPTSPLYPAVAGLLWVNMGVVASTPRAEAGVRHEVHQLDYPAWWNRMYSWTLPPGVPKDLDVVLHAMKDGARKPYGEVDEGPPAPVVRRLVSDLEDLALHANIPLIVLQECKARWSDPRSARREDALVRWLGSDSGGPGSDNGGLLCAGAVLRRDTARQPRTLGNRAEDPAVRSHGGALAWTLATYALAAEAAHLQGQADHLAAAVQASWALADARARLHRARELREEYASRAQAGTALLAVEEEVWAASAQVDQAKAAMEPFWLDRGADEHVGAAGERILAVELELLAAQLRALAARMAQAPCVARWQRHHPDAAKHHPLSTTQSALSEEEEMQRERRRIAAASLPRYGQALSDLGQ